MAYDFSAWVASFVAMATLQYLVGYSTRHDIIPSALLGVGCGVVFVAVGLSDAPAPRALRDRLLP